ncbi:ankyrin repeat domain-containing protein, partial [Legionella nautarum]|uniref:ankyrin repeat domain-containing protein n=1 Tax=Legionella nautarum TaxID=45070 RepID=UPI00187DBD14
FYSICEPEFQARPEPENELELLRWAVLRNRGKPDELTLETIGLALEGGLSDLSREFLTSPEIQVSYNVIELRQLLTSAMRSGQRDIMTAYDNFMADCKKLNSANESIVDLVEESQDIYSLLKFAALEGIIPIFNQLANRLQQEITQKEQELNETQTSFSKEKIAKLSANLKRAKTKFEDAMASAMRSAAEHGHIDLIKYALKKQFISINQKCEYTTLLAQATESRQDNLMQFLLDNGADPEEGLYIILIRIVNSSYNSILKHILKPGVFTLLKAIEKRGELKSIKLIQQCSVNGRLDLLVRLFDLDQGRLIKPDTIQKLLSKDCPVKCRNFLQKKLAQAQSAIALKASAEEQPNDSSSDEAEDFF